MKITWTLFFHQENTLKKDLSGLNMFLQPQLLEWTLSISKITWTINFNQDKPETLVSAQLEKSYTLNALMSWLDKLPSTVPREDSFLLESEMK